MNITPGLPFTLQILWRLESASSGWLASVQATVLHVQALLVPLHFIQKENQWSWNKNSVSTVDSKWTEDIAEPVFNTFTIFCRIQQISSLGEEVIINFLLWVLLAAKEKSIKFYGPWLYLRYPYIPSGHYHLAQMIKNLKWETWGQSLDWEDHEEEAATPQYSCLEIIGQD